MDEHINNETSSEMSQSFGQSLGLQSRTGADLQTFSLQRLVLNNVRRKVSMILATYFKTERALT